LITNRHEAVAIGAASDSCCATVHPDDFPMADYSAIVRRMTDEHRVRVRRWRRDSTGRAWQSTARDGTSVNYIEAPYPDSELKLAVCLHEIGHHVIGLHSWEYNCEAEYWAWDWAFSQMQDLGIEPGREVYARYDLSLRYAVYLERLRGARDLPDCVKPFIPQAA
jgi:hypothetical protein